MGIEVKKSSGECGKNCGDCPVVLSREAGSQVLRSAIASNGQTLAIWEGTIIGYEELYSQVLMATMSEAYPPKRADEVLLRSTEGIAEAEANKRIVEDALERSADLLKRKDAKTDAITARCPGGPKEKVVNGEVVLRCQSKYGLPLIRYAQQMLD